MGKYTPMIEQYLSIKKNYENTFLFYRLGDFYELFFADAVKAAKELEITLTSRKGGSTEPIPMCGVPYHSAQNYINILIERGYKVAICEQVSDPKASKGIVEREVVQVITPGMQMEGKSLVPKENNYIATVTNIGGDYFGVGAVDLTTGEQKVIKITGGFTEVLSELLGIGAKEVVVHDKFPMKWQKQIKSNGVLVISYENELDSEVEIKEELEQGLRETMQRIHSYIKRTQKRQLDHLQMLEVVKRDEHMKLDFYAQKHLEIFTSQRRQSKRGSLLWVIDQTETAMGGRKLKEWLNRPLFNISAIKERQVVVTVLLKNFFAREQIRSYLHKIYDLERLAGRVSYGNCHSRDLVQLCQSLEQIPFLKQELENIKDGSMEQFASELDLCLEIAELIRRAIVDDPPLSIKEGNFIRPGYREELDTLRSGAINGKKWIVELEQRERVKTGIRSLKIKYNRVFGYYFEITKANLSQLNDERFVRKQTMTNGERFVTEELKKIEEVVLSAEEKSIDLEYQLFLDIRTKIKGEIARLQKLARKISELDVLQSFATVSENNSFVCPSSVMGKELEVISGRHPVIEQILPTNTFVPNDTMMCSDNCETLLITGPNMGGKSTYMRQIALIAILHQIGCFVPAEKAKLPLFDQIFTRIGATDDLTTGQSTFMVEMIETNNALVNATESSLLLFDEIGRGTATYDGMALAQSVIEYIHDNVRCFTIFSTHYHELTKLDKKLPRLGNVHVGAVEQEGKVIFVHRVKEGPTDQSYGIHVAELVQMPRELIKRARDILYLLESNNNAEQDNVKQKNDDQRENKIANRRMTQLINELQSLDVMAISPLEALNQLIKIQEDAKKITTVSTNL